jgi:5-methylthioribose kinase
LVFYSIFGRAIAPVGINAWNPSFDVTPCSLIRGIITELGVIEAPSDAGADGIIPIAHYLLAHAQHKPTLIERASVATIPTAAPAGYVRMDEPKIGAYLVANEMLSGLLDVQVGSDVNQLKIAEIGDGNINYVYIVEGPTGRKLIIKQALPYVRCVGESWPMSLRRAYFETAALIETRRLTDGKFVPEVYHFDSAKSLIGEPLNRCFLRFVD